MVSKSSKKLSIHASQYFVAQLLTICGGFLTFPLLTRMLSKTDYGTVNLVNTAIGLCVIVSKFGLQNATVRFLPKAKIEGETASEKIYTTVVLTNLVTSICSAILLYVAATILFPNFEQISIRYIIPCAAALVVTKTLNLCFLTFFRANQKSSHVSMYQVANKYLAIGLLCYIFFFYQASAGAFFIILLCSEMTILLVCSTNFLKNNSISFKKYSTKFLKNALIFGLPLLGFELITELLAYSDRYLIQYFLGAEELAVYSAGYNLADYVRTLLLYPLAFAVTPLLSEIWEKEGALATEKFVSESLSKFWYILIPAIFGVTLLGGEILVALASEKYADSYVVIPYVIVGSALYGTFPLTGAGLFVKNQTNILFYLVLVAVIFNVSLNLYLIPLHGIVGAAESTLISYLILCALIIVVSRKYLRIKIFSFSILKALFISVIMVLVLKSIKLDAENFVDNKFILLVGNIIVGTMIYFTILITLDRKIRKTLFGKINGYFATNRNKKNL